ncbi:DNA-binding transcriptional regulator, ArsR family [Pseudarcicella hirudinis]|uniref:DNA-binding transcriptional regulator, ArsR family n=1 Tax=Pseudarcicella hirudinis TaxID=1079859 RepID=A0A1I5RNM3_9BACT|nr:winged helix-turn-helix domain-containing protein [Pseudarcicella hirudinis]SFP59990.1 DNA-binding transcriptional regulator, ArsR family [Pseudarcicella hirudinis]
MSESVNQENIRFIEKAANAVSDKYRLSILMELTQKGEICCNEAREITGLSQSCCSHHIKLLTESELITARKDGKYIYISLNKQNFHKFSDFLKHIIEPE